MTAKTECQRCNILNCRHQTSTKNLSFFLKKIRIQAENGLNALSNNKKKIEYVYDDSATIRSLKDLILGYKTQKAAFNRPRAPHLVPKQGQDHYTCSS